MGRGATRVRGKEEGGDLPDKRATLIFHGFLEFREPLLYWPSFHSKYFKGNSDKTASFSQLSSDLKCVGSFRSKRLFTGGRVGVAKGGGGGADVVGQNEF